MPTIARVLPWLVLAFSLLALALGLYEWSHPPFTADQLEASPTTTWEVATSTTRVFAIVFLGLGLICAFIARKSDDPRLRLVAYLASASCLATLLIFLRNQADLAARVSAATGLQVGPLFGLL